MIQLFLNKVVGYKEDISICKNINALLKSIYEYKFDRNKAEECFHELERMRQLAIRSEDEEFANSTYIIKQLVKFLINYNRYMDLIGNEDYKGSWSVLQDIQDNIYLITKYEDYDLFDCLSKYFSTIEKLYPYNAFASIEVKITKDTCSICGKSLLKAECDHIQGELCWGEPVVSIVEGIGQLDAVAFVKHPKDKRCVIEVQDNMPNEEYFKAVHIAKKILLNPFLLFDVNTKEKNIQNKKGNDKTKEKEMMITIARPLVFTIFRESDISEFETLLD